jgi:hypothetical protein
MESRALLSAVTWTGAAGDHNWDTPGNWTGDAVPGSADDVTINTGARVVHSTDAIDTIHNLNVTGGTVDVQSGYLTLQGGTDTGATFTVDSGAWLQIGGTETLDSTSRIGGAGTVDFEGSSGTIGVAGTYDVTGTTTENYNGSVDFTGTVSSIGAALTSSGGTLNFTTPFTGTAGTIAAVQIGGATVNLGTNALDATTLDLGGTLTGTGAITVSGLLKLEGGTISGSGPVNADGGIEGYVFNLDGRTLTNPAGQTANQSGGGLLSDGAVIDNRGTWVESGGTFYQGTGASSSFNDQGSFTAAQIPFVGGVIFEPGVTFNATGGTVSVQSGLLDLGGGGTETGAAFTIAADWSLELSGAFTLDSGTTFSGAGTLRKYDTTTVLYPGNSASFSGPTYVIGGTLLVDGSLAGSAVTVTTLSVGPPTVGTLGGTGTVGPITSNSGTISPGDGATASGILTADGNVTLDSGSTFNVALNGATAGTGYDQLNVTGSVNLGGSALVATLGFTPTAGETFSIIKSTAPIVGTFKGLSEGASVTIGGIPFEISYAADGGDAAVLTPSNATTAATTTTMSSSANPATVGQGVTFTATVAAASGTGTPTGTVTFTVDGHAQTPSALAVVNGVDEATFTTNSLAAGPHTIGATYSGDTAFAPSAVTTPLTQTVSTPTAPAVTTTQVVSTSASSTVGQAVTFKAIITGSGTVAPTGTVTFTIDGRAEPPVPLSEVGGPYQATLTVSTLTVGTHTIVAAYSGDAHYAPSRSSQQTQVVLPASAGTPAGTGTPVPAPVVTDGPRIVSMLRYGYHMMPTRIVLTFDQALDAVTAEDAKDYRIIGPAGRSIAIKSAVYDAANRTVTLRPVERISIHHRYELIVDGTAPHGLTNTRGRLLDGANRGTPDSDYRAPLTWRNLVLDPPWPRASHRSKT